MAKQTEKKAVEQKAPAVEKQEKASGNIIDQPPVDQSKEPERKTKEEMQEELKPKYENGDLNAEELDENYTIPEIEKYAEKHDIWVDMNENKPEIIEQVLLKVSASEKKEKDQAEKKGEDLVSEIENARTSINDILEKTKSIPDTESINKGKLGTALNWLTKLIDLAGGKPSEIKKSEALTISQQAYQFQLLDKEQRTKELKKEINLISDQIDSLDLSSVPSEKGRHAAIARTNAYNYLQETQFELEEKF